MPNAKRIFSTLACCLITACLTAQNYRPDRPALETSDSLPELDRPDANGDPDLETIARHEWDDILRSSDTDPQRATDWRRRSRPYDDERLRDKTRIGCICMDGFFSEATGRGACSTRGGVRHWVYGYANGDTMHWATFRHRAHPEALTEAELLGLAAYNPDTKAKKKNPEDGGGFWQFAGIALGIGFLQWFLRRMWQSGSIHIFIHPRD